MKTILRLLLVGIIVVHGLIHLLGIVKGFGWAEVAALKQPIGKGAAMVWLAAAVLVVAAGVTLALQVQWWWLVAVLGAVVSQAAIVTTWNDAKAGTIANALLVLVAIYAYLSQPSPTVTALYS